jgi:protein subunit release factor B
MEKKLLFSLSKDNGDFIVTPFKGSGKGGQKRNKTSSACRISHPASGAVAECQDERYFHVNQQRAFERLLKREEFKAWLRLETARKTGQLMGLEEKVEREMKNVRVDVKDEHGIWVDEKDAHIALAEKH